MTSYINLKSVTWWVGLLSLIRGILIYTGTLSPDHFGGNGVDDIQIGLGLIGLRAAIGRDS